MSQMASTTSDPTPVNKNTSESMDSEELLSPNFAQPKSSSSNRLSIGFDHEVYLELTAGDKAAEKTVNQIYLEVCSWVSLFESLRARQGWVIA